MALLQPSLILPHAPVLGFLKFRVLASAMNDGGIDSDGNPYVSREDMWRREAGIGVDDCSKRDQWYQKGISYWENVDATVDGVLGGYGTVSSRDVTDSTAFIREMLEQRLPGAKLDDRKLVALDCGAGVGRVTKNFLLRHFHEVDLVEPVQHFLDAARKSLVEDAADTSQAKATGKAVNFYCTPLQEFTPEANRYDVIWVQWCIGHLTDDDLLEFFKRAQVGLKPDGFFVLKENIAKQGFVVDKLDSSVTRSDAYFRDLFHRGDLHILKSKLQRGFPRELFAVKMYALVAKVEEIAPTSKNQAPAEEKKSLKSKSGGHNKRKANQPKVLH